MEYTIPVDMLKAALLSVSKEQTRYYLGGVLMQRREGILRMVSTDGHRMFVGAINLDDGLQSDFDAILPTADVKKALTGLTRKDDFVQMDLDIAKGDVESVKLNGVEFRPIDGTFPTYDRIVPTQTSGVAADFDPRYYADLGKAAKLLSGSETAMTIAQNGNDPAIISFTTRKDCFVVLMPRRADKADRITQADIGAIMGQPDRVADIEKAQAAEKAA
jgi:DNA polymerase III sliding clamp (beta) subunit (PCNA family)